ncbi:hypothetical protein ACFL96_10925 [Thermoproteota archaeon]
MSHVAVFDGQWVDHSLGIDNFTGMWKFKRMLKKAIITAIISGALLTGLPKFASAATADQAQTLKDAITVIKYQDSVGNKAKMNQAIDILLHTMMDMLKTLRHELNNGEYAKAKKTSKLLMDYAELCGIEARFKGYIKQVHESVAAASRNQNLPKAWKEAQHNMHQFKKAKKTLPSYKVRLKGPNWIFEVHHVNMSDLKGPLAGAVSGKGFGVRARIEGGSLNIKQVNDTLEKTDMSDTQKDHTRVLILRTLQSDFPRVILVAK